MFSIPTFSLPSSELGKSPPSANTPAFTALSVTCDHEKTSTDPGDHTLPRIACEISIPEALAPGDIAEGIMFSGITSVEVEDVIHSSENTCTNCADVRKLSDDVDDDTGTKIFVAENVIAADERLRVTPCTSQPYKWICYLEISTVTGITYKGTGFFNTMLGPEKPGLILTCAHNLFLHNHGGFAKKIKVYPGRDMGSTPYGHFTVYPGCFKVPDAWKESKSPEHDYGAIFITDPNLLPKTVYGFGYKLLEDSELEKRVITIAGYPGDKPDGTLWVAGGTIGHVLPRAVHYDNDTEGGQSGSPVWTWDKYNWMVVGIHGYGGSTRNSARRLTPDLVRQVYMWSEEVPPGALSAHTTNRATYFRHSSYSMRRTTIVTGRETTV